MSVFNDVKAVSSRKTILKKSTFYIYLLGRKQSLILWSIEGDQVRFWATLLYSIKVLNMNVNIHAYVIYGSNKDDSFYLGYFEPRISFCPYFLQV